MIITDEEKRCGKMYRTEEIMTSKPTNSFTVKVKNFDKHNSFAYGYGYHDKSGRARHKEERRNSKQLCRDYEI